MFLRLLPLVLANLRRNRRRSLLTVLGTTVAVLVFGSLSSAIDRLTMGARQAGAEETLSVRRAGRMNVLASRLPENYEDRVAALRGVTAATGVVSELAILGERNVHVFLNGIDPRAYRAVQKFELHEDEWTSFAEDPRSALVGHRLLEKMGWRVGDEILLPRVRLKVRIAGGIPPQGLDLESNMLVHRESLQVLRRLEGQVTFVRVAAKDVALDDLALQIDETFAMAAVTTKTTTSGKFAEAVVEEFMGFTDYLKFMGIITVLVTMLGAANAIAMSVRERIRDFGILKTIGYRPAEVVVLVVIESTLLAVVGGLLGVVLTAWLINSRAAQLEGMVWKASTVPMMLLMASIIGAGGAFVPAVRAARLRPVDALRVID